MLTPILYIPNLLLAIIILLVKLGPSNARTIVRRYPGTIMMPMLCPFTSGQPPCCNQGRWILNCNCLNLCSKTSNKLQLSIKYSAINAIISFSCTMVAGILVERLDLSRDNFRGHKFLWLLPTTALVWTLMLLFHMKKRGTVMNQLEIDQIDTNNCNKSNIEQQTDQENLGECIRHICNSGMTFKLTAHTPHSTNPP